MDGRQRKLQERNRAFREQSTPSAVALATMASCHTGAGNPATTAFERMVDAGFKGGMDTGVWLASDNDNRVQLHVHGAGAYSVVRFFYDKVEVDLSFDASSARAFESIHPAAEHALALLTAPI